jgi:predicted DNA-binding transcriptional regulator AlpA
VNDPAKNNGIHAELLQSLLEPLLDLLADKIAERMNGKKSPKEDRLLTLEELCAVLNVSPQWVYHNIKKLPFTRKVGGMLRFSANGLQRYIEASKFKGV